jgi:uncharacterized protein YndB with AHSA1/START domain
MENITLTTYVEAPVNTVWDFWIEPEDIREWYHASDDWHTPSATNDFRIGGTFHFMMAANDKSESFDFEGTYTDIVEHEIIEYALADGRKVSILFEKKDGGTQVTETFETENSHTIEEQRLGWQSILDNFKLYVESYL